MHTVDLYLLGIAFVKDVGKKEGGSEYFHTKEY